MVREEREAVIASGLLNSGSLYVHLVENNTVTVYQPDYFGFALFSVLPFAIMVGVTIYEYRTKKGSERQWAWASLLLAMSAIFMAFHYWSKAYDLPKHESQRTVDLEWIAIAFNFTWMFIVLIVLRRHTSKNRQVQSAPPNI